jgi:hypothetical protein
MRNGAHLEGQRDRRLAQAILARFDHRGSSESRSIEIGGERHDDDGLQCSRSINARDPTAKDPGAA